MRSIFAQLVGLSIASLIFLVLFPPPPGLLGVLWVIGFFVSYAVIGGMIDSWLENIFDPPEKQREKIIKEVLSKPSTTDTPPSVRTINNIVEPKYYTAEELVKDFSKGTVDDSRIPPNLGGYYAAIKRQHEKAQIRQRLAQQDKPSLPKKDYYQMRKNISNGYWRVTPEQIRAMDWREFEQFIANLFTEQGYKTTLTPAQHDEGKDVIAEKDGKIYYIECKHWKEDSFIGRELVQKLVGAAMSRYNVTNVIFIATCKFHDNAKNYAKEVNFAGRIHIELWNIHRLLKEANAVPNAQLKSPQLKP